MTYATSVAEFLSSVPLKSGKPSLTNSSSAIPAHLKCPLTRELMEHPVVAPDGTVFERSAIIAVMRLQQVNPMTNRPYPADAAPVHEWPADQTVAAAIREHILAGKRGRPEMTRGQQSPSKAGEAPRKAPGYHDIDDFALQPPVVSSSQTTRPLIVSREPVGVQKTEAGSQQALLADLPAANRPKAAPKASAAPPRPQATGARQPGMIAPPGRRAQGAQTVAAAEVTASKQTGQGLQPREGTQQGRSETIKGVLASICKFDQMMKKPRAAKSTDGGTAPAQANTETTTSAPSAERTFIQRQAPVSVLGTREERIRMGGRPWDRTWQFPRQVPLDFWQPGDGMRRIFQNELHLIMKRSKEWEKRHGRPYDLRDLAR